MKMIPSFVLTAFCFFVSGCVVIPVPVAKKPFGKEATSPIKPGITTRADILGIFGDPLHRHLNDKLFMYRELQFKGLVATFGGSGEWNRAYFLIVEFDEKGIVVDATRVTNEGVLGTEGFNSEKRCTKSGYCLSGGEKSRGDNLSLHAPKKQDAAAKQFAPNPDSCTIYVAVNSRIHYRIKNYYLVSKLLLDDKPIAIGLFKWKENVFYRYRTEPGRHLLRIGGGTDILGIPKPSEEVLYFSCVAGSIHFFEISARSAFDAAFRIKEPTYPRKLENTEGRRSIMERALVIDPMPSFPPSPRR